MEDMLELQLMRMHGLKDQQCVSIGGLDQVATHAYAWLEGPTGSRPPVGYLLQLMRMHGLKAAPRHRPPLQTRCNSCVCMA